MAVKVKIVLLVLCVWFGQALAQDGIVAEPAQLAFEEGRWTDAIREYREILAEYPEDRVSWLRIAQAERELGRYETALATLERAMLNEAPEAMVHVERARNLLGLGRPDEALIELETADHVELRAPQLLAEAEDFDAIRQDPRFERIYRNVSARVHPCESSPEASEFDFWLGEWEVRGSDGRLLGHDSITRADGGCSIHERWVGNAGSTGSSILFYLPSRSQWRQVWVGSGGTHIDMTGSLTDGEMQLEGTIEYLDQDQVIAFRGTWSVGAGGRVRQRMEQFDLVSQSWELWFDGFFRKVD
jgi:tetratricopeptide (TPR) repeat protein